MKTWLTVEEAVPVLKMSRQAIYTAIRERQLPDEAILRIGKRIRIDPTVLDKAADKNVKSNGSEARNATR